MRAWLLIAFVLLLPSPSGAALMTLTVTGTADITFDGTTINGTTITVSVQIDDATVDSLANVNRGLFSGGAGSITLPDFGVTNATLANIDSVLLVDNGNERIGLVDSTRSEGLVLRNNTSSVISDPNTLTGFAGPLVASTVNRRLPIILSDGREVTGIGSPTGFVAAATPEPSGVALMSLAGIGLVLRRRRLRCAEAD